MRVVSNVSNLVLVVVCNTSNAAASVSILVRVVSKVSNFVLVEVCNTSNAAASVSIAVRVVSNVSSFVLVVSILLFCVMVFVLIASNITPALLPVPSPF